MSARARARVCVCVCVHWLCASDDQTGHGMAWRSGILTGITMQSLALDVAIRRQIARYDHAMPRHGGVMAWWLAARQSSMHRKSPHLTQVRLESNQPRYFAVLFVRPSTQRGPHTKPLVYFGSLKKKRESSKRVLGVLSCQVASCLTPDSTCRERLNPCPTVHCPFCTNVL